jgi:hypothetical protein
VKKNESLGFNNAEVPFNISFNVVELVGNPPLLTPVTLVVASTVIDFAEVFTEVTLL